MYPPSPTSLPYISLMNYLSSKGLRSSMSPFVNAKLSSQPRSLQIRCSLNSSFILPHTSLRQKCLRHRQPEEWNRIIINMISGTDILPSRWQCLFFRSVCPMHLGEKRENFFQNSSNLKKISIIWSLANTGGLLLIFVLHHIYTKTSPISLIFSLLYIAKLCA